jgi:hypothetical protein
MLKRETINVDILIPSFMSGSGTEIVEPAADVEALSGR